MCVVIARESSTAAICADGRTIRKVFFFFFIPYFFIVQLIACGEQSNKINPETENTCPKGHTDNVIPIRYGMPDEASMKESERGEVYPGGCEMTDDSPKWYCKTHEITF